MKRNSNYVKPGMTRRNFIGTSALAMGGLPFITSFSFELNNEIGLSLNSPMNTKIRIKLINDQPNILHEDAWEGSCRVGDLKDLTYEAEKEQLRASGERLKKTLLSLKLPKEVEILDPVVTMHAWVEKGNPDIILPEDQLDSLARDNDRTDLYVLSSAFIGHRIAARYRKPVCVMQPNGWGVDGAAAIRSLGVEGYHVHNWEELFELTRLMMVKKAFANTKLLFVTNSLRSVPWGTQSNITNLDTIKSKYGMDYENIDYREFFSYMDSVEKDSKMVNFADSMADNLLKNALSSNMTRESISKSIMFYLTTGMMMQKLGCNSFTIGCFELCSSLHPWNRKFTPCLTHALLKDSGIPSSCDGDVNALLAMMVQKYLSNKAIYMGNPQIDQVNNELILNHSVASLKMLGLDKDPSPYHIHSFMMAGHGATLRHAFIEHSGEKSTVGRFDPTGTKMLISSGEVIGGRGTDSGFRCSQAVEIKIPNGRALWKASQNYGHHLAFVYGDYTNQIEELGEMMKFDVENIK